ncbi:MAG: MFS transporter, partial [Planctomycetota bacterium]
TSLSFHWCLLGLFDGVQFSTGLALLGRRVRRGAYGRVHGLRMAANALGTASAPLMVSVASVGWRPVFILTAMFTVVATIGFLLGVPAEPDPEPCRAEDRRAPSTGEKGLSGLLAGLVALTCLVAVAGQSLTSFTQQFLVTERHFSIRDSAALLTVLMVLGVLGPPLWGHVSDRFGRRLALVSALGAHSAGILAISLLPPGWMLVASFVVLGLVRSAVYPVAYALISEKFPESQGRIFGLSACLAQLSGALGLLAVGHLAESHGFITVFPALAVVPAAGVILVLAIERRSRQ